MADATGAGGANGVSDGAEHNAARRRTLRISSEERRPRVGSSREMLDAYGRASSERTGHLRIKTDGSARQERSGLEMRMVTADYFELLNASMNGNVTTVEALLRYLSAADASRLDTRKNETSFGESPLHRAKTVAIARLLVKHGVAVDIRGYVGQTPLHTQNNAEVARYLISKGADVNACTMDGSSPLHWAVVVDNLNLVRTLIRAGADVNHVNENGNSPLHMVGSVPVAKYLVSHNAAIDGLNKEGKLPLEVAADKGDDDVQLQVAAYLLDMSHEIGVSRSMRKIYTEGRYGSDSEDYDDSEVDEVDDVPNSLMNRLSVRVDSGNATSNNNEKAPRSVLKKSDQGSSMRLATEVSKKTDAMSRWQRVRAKVLQGDISGTGIRKSKTAAQRQLRFAVGSASVYTSSGSVHENEVGWGGDEAEEEESRTSNDFYASFFELMVRNRPKLALKLLDKQRTFLYAKGNDKVYSYDTSLVGGPTDSKQSLYQIVADERHDIISHEVVQWVLNIKWILFTRECLLFEFFLHAAFVILFMVSTLYGSESLLVCYEDLWKIFLGEVRAMPNHVGHILQIPLELVLVYLNVRYIVRLYVEWKMTYKGSFCHILSKLSLNDYTAIAPHGAVFASQILRSVLDPGDEDGFRVANSLNSVAAIILWVRCLSFAEGFEAIGVAMCTIRRMIADIVIYFFVMIIFVTGFSHAMALVYAHAGVTLYDGMFNTWITLYFFIFNLDMGVMDEETSMYRKYMGYFLIGIYMVVVVLVILNLIIAVMTNSFEDIQQNAKEQWLLQRAKLIIKYEQREESMNHISDFFSFARTMKRTVMPPLPRKNPVTEKSGGLINIEVPTDWLHAVNFQRVRSRHYHGCRYGCFKRWKRMRRSPSFLWPAFDESHDFLVKQRDMTASLGQINAKQSSTLQSLGDDLSVLDEEEEVGNEKKPLLPHISTSSFGTIESKDKKLKRFTTRENAELRTGLIEDFTYIGKFFRNPKRIQHEREARLSENKRFSSSGGGHHITSPRNRMHGKTNSYASAGTLGRTKSFKKSPTSSGSRSPAQESNHGEASGPDDKLSYHLEDLQDMIRTLTEQVSKMQLEQNKLIQRLDNRP
eukprot:CAMPEP_0203759120 /NCGR_PEP_ID=MMETSP0098-20131031/12051_1 /ASSEMBLY_ACC=CAM_ASM_000208 /TAXON_ID=96639 /ORGANISM=" , Strain NY0313808BC1" /LENGTH=1097 /DNA_ID=CAMNT_0050651877 /DNA_START=48 /DNA_END=3341 /DNA_ORIENTATION=+